jgi:hypothetical protein
MFPVKVVEKIRTHFMFSGFFPENYSIYENVKKYGGARKDTENMVPGHGILDK